MQHDIKNACPSHLKNSLLENVCSLSSFMRNIEDICNNYVQDIEDNFITPLNFKGDAFESFIEVFLKVFGIDNRIGILEYSPWDESEFGNDYGVDGIGKFNGKEDKLVAVQCKYRKNVTYQLNANDDHISNFVAYTKTSPIFNNAKMFIFTTCKGLRNDINEKMYHGELKVFGFSEINKVLGNNNLSFWETYKNELNSM